MVALCNFVVVGSANVQEVSCKAVEKQKQSSLVSMNTVRRSFFSCSCR